MRAGGRRARPWGAAAERGRPPHQRAAGAVAASATEAIGAIAAAA